MRWFNTLVQQFLDPRAGPAPRRPRKRAPRLLEVESLDERALPTPGLGVTPPEPGVPALVARHGHRAAHPHGVLRGRIQGTWVNRPTLPDTGSIQLLTGSGTVAPLGSATAQGNLHTPGFVLRGRTEGMLTLSGPRGSITVRLVGPEQRGFSPPPSTFHYRIIGGTGRFAGASGSGTARFHEQSGPVCEPGLPCDPLVHGGTFTLTFGPSPSQ
jgi:hypothetical protein